MVSCKKGKLCDAAKMDYFRNPAGLLLDSIAVKLMKVDSPDSILEDRNGRAIL